jgi:hypothetical protein
MQKRKVCIFISEENYKKLLDIVHSAFQDGTIENNRLSTYITKLVEVKSKKND